MRELWVYLSASPLLWLTATLLAYVGAQWLQARGRQHPLLNPVAVSVAALVALLALTRTPYATYFDGAQFVHFLLGPAIVALAVPLYAQLPRLKTLALPILVSLVAGMLTAALSAMGVGWLFGLPRESLISLAPKSVTAPVAMGIAEKLGGLPSLTAVLVVLTGILGAAVGKALFDALRIRDDAVRGVAIGVTSHGIGTARAFQVSAEMGAFAGLAMALSTILTALVLPLVVRALGL